MPLVLTLLMEFLPVVQAWTLFHTSTAGRQADTPVGYSLSLPHEHAHPVGPSTENVFRTLLHSVPDF